MSRMPCSSQMARSARRNAAGAGLKPPSPWTGSMRMAATVDGAMTVARSDCRWPAPAATRLLVAAEIRIGLGNGREVDPRQQRLVAGPVVEVRGRDAGRAERPAVEAAAERDDPGPAGHPAGELERAVDRLGARVQEHHRIERVREGRGERRRQARDRLGEADRRDRPDELVDLGVDRRRHPRMGVAQRRDRDAVGEVEVRLAVGVVQPVALAVAPRPLEVAAQDGRQVRAASAVTVGLGPDGGAGRVYRPAVGRRRDEAASPARPRTMPAMVDFTLTDENRLVQQSVRAFAESRDPARTSASGTRRARSTARSSPGWPSWASSARRSPRRTAARGWTTSASRSCARSWSVPTPRSASSRASTSGSIRWPSCSGGPRSSASAGWSRRRAARSSRRSG